MDVSIEMSHTLPDKNPVSVTGGKISEKKEKKKKMLTTIRSTAVALLFIIAIHVVFIYVYFGALWNIEHGYSKLPVVIQNADQGINGLSLGEKLSDILGSLNSTYVPDKKMFDWKKIDHSNDTQTLRDDVFHEKYWMAIYIPEGLTQDLMASLYGLKKYNSSIQIIYDEGRQYTTLSSMRVMTKLALSAINTKISQAILSGQFGPVNVSRADVTALTAPIQYVEVNLHPAGSLGPAFSTYMGYIIMWLSCILVVNVIAQTTLTVNTHEIWGVTTLTLIRIGLSILSGLFLALLLTGITAGFELEFAKGFGISFLFNWLVACTFLSILGGIYIIFGTPGVILNTLLLYIQIGSSNSIYTAELMNSFYYKLGPVFPFYHAVEGARTIAFGSANNLPLNVGVLFAWTIICSVTSFFTMRLKINKIIRSSMNKDVKSAVDAVSGS